jgi:hypothetical protein
MTTIAVMQPYFFPYAGYFRLFAAADIFVIYDCVQFPRRGWVHRNQLPDANGEPRWLTLPLAKAARTVRIRDLCFADGATDRLAARSSKFPALVAAREADHPMVKALGALDGRTTVDYLEATLAATCAALGLSCHVVRSSSLGIAQELKGQNRILAIAEELGARSYVNPPGGRALYDAADFAGRGITLRFLERYHGPTWSILQRLLSEPAAAVATEIAAQV